MQTYLSMITAQKFSITHRIQEEKKVVVSVIVTLAVILLTDKIILVQTIKLTQKSLSLKHSGLFSY